MNNHVFTYGSLMFDQVWTKLVGDGYSKTKARLYGFKRKKIRGETYPAIIPGAASDRVDGQLYKSVSKFDIDRLDRFEGKYYYRKLTECELPDGSKTHALVYVLKQEYMVMAANEDWNPDWFSQVGIHAFLSGYKGFA